LYPVSDALQQTVEVLAGIGIGYTFHREFLTVCWLPSNIVSKVIKFATHCLLVTLTWFTDPLNCSDEEEFCRGTQRCVPRYLLNDEFGCELNSKVTFPCREGEGKKRFINQNNI